MKAETIRKHCQDWPGVTEDIKWGSDLVFSVAGKMFCVLDMAQIESGGSGRLGFKVESERFLELTDRPGIVPAPYLARAHWISLTVPDPLPAAEISALIRRSYELVFANLPKSKQRELGNA
jgi:predicted DNA-binding protein (MmcQ/YjbR family)